MNIFNIESPSAKCALIDADSIVYHIGYACDMLDGDKRFALRLLDQSVSDIYENTGCATAELYLGTKTNYRNDIAKLKEYKSNRKNVERPKYYDAIRHRMVEDHGAMLCEDEEAEDVVGIRSFEFDDLNDFIICKIDKDLDMMPGSHYNYRTGKNTYFTKVEALRKFYCQLVTGDSTDAIPGLYHQLLIDKEDVKAKKFRYSRYKSKLLKALEDCNTEMEMYRAALKSYEDYGQIERHGIVRIIEVGRLLWIRRYVGELWLPPTERNFSYLTIDMRRGEQ